MAADGGRDPIPRKVGGMTPSHTMQETLPAHTNPGIRANARQPAQTID